MTKKGRWGGARPHPPGKEGGRPKNPYPLRVINIACTEEEYQAILDSNTRERTKKLLGKESGGKMKVTSQVQRAAHELITELQKQLGIKDTMFPMDEQLFDNLIYEAFSKFESRIQEVNSKQEVYHIGQGARGE